MASFHSIAAGHGGALRVHSLTSTNDPPPSQCGPTKLNRIPKCHCALDPTGSRAVRFRGRVDEHVSQRPVHWQSSVHEDVRLPPHVTVSMDQFCGRERRSEHDSDVDVAVTARFEDAQQTEAEHTAFPPTVTNSVMLQ
jgi:hypothetical protein